MTGRTAAYGRAAFAWAVKRAMVPGNPFAHLPVAKGVAKRQRVLSDSEIAEIWQASGKSSLPYSTIIRLLILTGQRRGEVAGMTWSEISEDMATWTLPGERTKNGAAHTVPLSPSARDLLRVALPEGANKRHPNGSLALPGALGTPFAGWSKAKRGLDRAITDACAHAAGKAGTGRAPFVPWSVHDLRRTVATDLQRLGVRLEVTEAVLNHVSGSRGGIAGVYQRHDWATEKRAASMPGRLTFVQLLMAVLPVLMWWRWRELGDRHSRNQGLRREAADLTMMSSTAARSRPVRGCTLDAVAYSAACAAAGVNSGTLPASLSTIIVRSK